jgi:UPF0755 protein
MPRRRHSRKSPYQTIVTLSVVMILGAVGAKLWLKRQLEVPLDPDSEEQITYVVYSGEHGRGTSHGLKENNLIRSKWAFYWELKQSDKGGSIQAGTYVLSPSMSALEIIDALTGEVQAEEQAFTIPEGWTISQIDNKLSEQGFIQAGDFEFCSRTCDFSEYSFLDNASSLEGYLFPDTFYIDPNNFSSEAFIHRLLDNFETKVLTDSFEADVAASGRTLDEIVIMASIVEREGLWDEDLPLIAGILWKRYDNDWGLGADATLLYVLGDESELVANLELEDPYNTRKYRGLPPTAISNPGLKSLEASLYPEESSYWFYLTDLDTGKAHYAETNDEHNANKVEWLY